VSRYGVIFDLVLAVVIVVVVLIVSPGPAVDGLLALVVLLICGLTLLIDSRLARRRRRAVRRVGPRTRPPIHR
jgi:ABC-type Fe3+ transport system permease subunit